jgi:hypothetical protein
MTLDFPFFQDGGKGFAHFAADGSTRATNRHAPVADPTGYLEEVDLPAEAADVLLGNFWRNAERQHVGPVHLDPDPEPRVGRPADLCCDFVDDSDAALDGATVTVTMAVEEWREEK